MYVLSVHEACDRGCGRIAQDVHYIALVIVTHIRMYIITASLGRVRLTSLQHTLIQRITNNNKWIIDIKTST